MIVKANWNVNHLLVNEGLTVQLKEHGAEGEDLVIQADRESGGWDWAVKEEGASRGGEGWGVL